MLFTHLTHVSPSYGSGRIDTLSMPEVNWKGFLQGIEDINKTTHKVYNPASGKQKDWVDVAKLNKSYQGGCVIM